MFGSFPGFFLIYFPHFNKVWFSISPFGHGSFTFALLVIVMDTDKRSQRPLSKVLFLLFIALQHCMWRHKFCNPNQWTNGIGRGRHTFISLLYCHNSMNLTYRWLWFPPACWGLTRGPPRCPPCTSSGPRELPGRARWTGSRSPLFWRLSFCENCFCLYLYILSKGTLIMLWNNYILLHICLKYNISRPYVNRLFKQTLQFLQQINMKKCPSSIRRLDSNS